MRRPVVAPLAGSWEISGRCAAALIAMAAPPREPLPARPPPSREPLPATRGHVDAGQRVPDTQAMERGVHEQCAGTGMRVAGDGTDAPAWITPSEAARILGVHTTTLYKLIATGRLRVRPAAAFSGDRRQVSADDVAAYAKRPGRRARTQRTSEHAPADPMRPALAEIVTLGERVRAFRQWRNISLPTAAAAVAARAAATGGPSLDRGHLSRIETGQIRVPARLLLAHLAAVLDVPEEELLAGLEATLYPPLDPAVPTDPSLPPRRTGTETFGERVRTLRRWHKLTVVALAADVSARAHAEGKRGIGPDHLGKVERGDWRTPPQRVVAYLAAALHTTDDDLLACRGMDLDRMSPLADEHPTP